MEHRHIRRNAVGVDGMPLGAGREKNGGINVLSGETYDGNTADNQIRRGPGQRLRQRGHERAGVREVGAVHTVRPPPMLQVGQFLDSGQAVILV